jgi:lipoprotein-releasing system permease protein
MGSTKLGVSATMVMDQQYDSTFALTSLESASSIFGTEGCADMLMVKVADGVSHEKVASRLRSALGKGYKVTLREDKNKSFYIIMRHEKWAIFFVSLLVLVVASLSIIGTVIMLVLEKRDERTTLLSIGADNAFIRGVFVREGLLVAGIGGVIGLVLGVGLTLAQQHFGFVKMPNDNFMIENYPVELQALDLLAIFIVVVVVAFGVSKVATSAMINRKNRC